jgi:hypothetical protein
VMAHTRHGEPFAVGSETSYEAALHARAFVSEQGVKVFRWLRDHGDYGGTQKEAAAALNIERPSLCAGSRRSRKSARFARQRRSGTVARRMSPSGVSRRRSWNCCDRGCRGRFVLGSRWSPSRPLGTGHGSKFEVAGPFRADGFRREACPRVWRASDAPAR